MESRRRRRPTIRLLLEAGALEVFDPVYYPDGGCIADVQQEVRRSLNNLQKPTLAVRTIAGLRRLYQRLLELDPELMTTVTFSADERRQRFRRIQEERPVGALRDLLAKGSVFNATRKTLRGLLDSPDGLKLRELMHKVRLAQTYVSRELHELRAAGIVDCRRNDKWHILPEQVDHVREILDRG